jgi:hypothetical protein
MLENVVSMRFDQQETGFMQLVASVYDPPKTYNTNCHQNQPLEMSYEMT